MNIFLDNLDVQHNFSDTTGNMSGQELCPNGNANELCGNTDIPKCISSSSHQKDRKQSISMIDLTNNVNDISYVRAGHQEETKVCCQTTSVEDICFRGKKMTQNALENDYLKERLLNNSAHNSCKDKQKELQGKLYLKLNFINQKRKHY
jgi:hypothetical protein